MTDQNDVVQDVLLYTQAELDEKVNLIRENLMASFSLDQRVTRNHNQDSILGVFRDLVRDDTLDKDTAVVIHNAIADAIGYDNVDSITTLYNVTVMFNGNEVGTFYNVEADDSDEAENIVLADMAVCATMDIQIEYNGENVENTIDIDSWDINDDLTAEAVEA